MGIANGVAVWGILVTILLGIGAPASAQNADVLTRAVVGYELTLPRVEAYASAIYELADWAAKNPNDVQVLRERGKADSLDAVGAMLESVPGIKRVLDRHQLTGKDFALIPLALLTSRAALMAEKNGAVATPTPPGRVNAATLDMMRANQPRIDALLAQITARQRALRGEK